VSEGYPPLVGGNTYVETSPSDLPPFWWRPAAAPQRGAAAGFNLTTDVTYCSP
jgi:hypothetical protein